MSANDNTIAWKVVIVQTVAGHRFAQIPGEPTWLNRSDLDRLAEALATIAQLLGAPEDET